MTQLARQRQLNPKDFHDDVHDLARVNPAKLAKDVTALARKKNAADAELDAADATTSLMLGGVGALATAAMIAVGAGSRNAERDKIIAEWESKGNDLDSGPTPWEVGVKDPTIAFWKIPWLAIPAAIAGTGYVIANRRRHGAAKGKRSIAGVGEVYLGFTSLFSTVMLIAKIASDRGFIKQAHLLTTGVKKVSITPAVKPAPKVANG
jgi:hypothetical protein